MSVRDRIVELRRVRAGSLIPDPRNWRVHPLHQREALRLMLEKIGFADALIVREEDGELILIDGHLRAEDVEEDQIVPVLVLDVTEDEAGMLLASLDPIGAMAQVERMLLDDMMENLRATEHDEDFLSFLTVVEENAKQSLVPEEPGDPEPGPEDPEPSRPSPPDPNSEYVVVSFRMSRDDYEAKMQVLAEAIEMLGVTPHVQSV